MPFSRLSQNSSQPLSFVLISIQHHLVSPRRKLHPSRRLLRFASPTLCLVSPTSASHLADSCAPHFLLLLFPFLFPSSFPGRRSPYKPRSTLHLSPIHCLLGLQRPSTSVQLRIPYTLSIVLPHTVQDENSIVLQTETDIDTGIGKRVHRMVIVWKGQG